MTEKEQAMQEIRRRHFAAIDAGMYLDGHPDDETALQYFRTMCRQKKQAEETYEKNFGPLRMSTAGGGNKWNWIDEPWPWEVK